MCINWTHNLTNKEMKELGVNHELIFVQKLIRD